AQGGLSGRLFQAGQRILLGGFQVQEATVDVLRRMLGGELRSVLGDVPPGEIVSEVERLALGSMEYHLERRLRSAALL
ncbi:MAG: hypothetical protein ACXW1S_00325, partial [Acidimicrobiia bacterium]